MLVVFLSTVSVVTKGIIEKKSENELKLPPIIALVKAVELDNPPKSFGCFKSINGKTKWLPKT